MNPAHFIIPYVVLVFWQQLTFGLSDIWFIVN